MTWRELRNKYPVGLPTGTVVSVEGEEYVVGDINGLGGTCDCCKAFKDDDEVDFVREP